jgi:hypothetical protein
MPLTSGSLRTTSWCSNRGQSGVVRPKCILPLPSRASVPHNNTHISRIHRNRRYHKRPHVSSRVTLPKPPQGLELLHFIFSPSGTGYECYKNRSHGKCHSASSYEQLWRKSTTYICALSPPEKNSLGECLPSFHEHGRHWYAIVSNRNQLTLD